MITKIEGDLLQLADEGYYGAIAHGCNCFHTMKGGIAYQIDQWSKGKASAVDKQTSYANINKLGECSYFEHNGVEVFNLYTQYTMIPKHRQGIEVAVHWESVYTAFINMFDNYQNMDKPIGIPYIGCGLAGGKKEQLENTLEEALNLYPQIHIEIVEYDS